MTTVAIQIEQDDLLRASCLRLRSDLQPLYLEGTLDALFHKWDRSVAELDFGAVAAHFRALMQQILVGFALANEAVVPSFQADPPWILRAAFGKSEDLGWLEELLEDLEIYEDPETYLEEIAESWASEHYDADQVPRHMPIPVAHLVFDLEGFVRCATDAQNSLRSKGAS